jgi:hypothetical protein
MLYEDKVIEHLSDEIKTHTRNMMLFRARINFAVFVGPFVLLGSLMVGAKGVPRSISMDWLTILAVIILAMSYILMASMCAAIERQMWRRCNIWRRVITKIILKRSDEITDDELLFPERVRTGYAMVYIAMIVAFVCAARIVSRVNVSP